MPSIVLTVDLSSLSSTGVITTAPWDCYGAVFPDHGGVPDLPQPAVEILQPPNVDGSRYRTGGLHYMRFRLAAIVAAANYARAQEIAREMEFTKGRYLSISGLVANAPLVYAIDCVANANAKRVVGASATVGNGGVPGGGAATGEGLASVDVLWTLQVAST